MVILGPNCAGCLRENVIRLRADQPDRAHHDDQDHSQHHCVLGNVLSLIVGPQVLQKFLHGRSPNFLNFAPLRAMVMPCYGQPGSRRIAHRCHSAPSRNSHEVTVGKLLLFSHLGAAPFWALASPLRRGGAIPQMRETSSRGPLAPRDLAQLQPFVARAPSPLNPATGRNCQRGISFPSRG